MASPPTAARDAAHRGTAALGTAGAAAEVAAAAAEDAVREGVGAAAGHIRDPPIRGRNIEAGALKLRKQHSGIMIGS